MASTRCVDVVIPGGRRLRRGTWRRNPGCCTHALEPVRLDGALLAASAVLCMPACLFNIGLCYPFGFELGELGCRHYHYGTTRRYQYARHPLTPQPHRYAHSTSLGRRKPRLTYVAYLPLLEEGNPVQRPCVVHSCLPDPTATPRALPTAPVIPCFLPCPILLCANLLQVCDALEDVMAEGGNVVDHHGCDFFPERCDAGVLWYRPRWVPAVSYTPKTRLPQPVDEDGSS